MHGRFGNDSSLIDAQPDLLTSGVYGTIMPPHAHDGTLIKNNWGAADAMAQGFQPKVEAFIRFKLSDLHAYG